MHVSNGLWGDASWDFAGASEKSSLESGWHRTWVQVLREQSSVSCGAVRYVAYQEPSRVALRDNVLTKIYNLFFAT